MKGPGTREIICIVMFEQKPLFGGTSSFIFGQQTQSTQNIFGTSNPTQAVVPFGQQPQPSATPFLFGQQQPSINNPSTNLFQPQTPGTSAFSFGQTQNAQTTPSFLGGASTGGGLFGMATTPQTASTTIKFKAPTAQDTMHRNGIDENVTIKIQCISAMEEYKNKSLEEFRLEDYMANPKSATVTGLGLGSTPFQLGQTGSSLFGGTPQSSATTNLFGVNSNPSIFGTSSSSFLPFATPSLFGQQTSQPTAAATPFQFGARAQKFVQDGTQCGTQYYNTLQKRLSTNYEKLQGYRSLRQFLKDRPLVSFVSATVLLFTFFTLITFLSFVLGSFCFTLFGFIMIEGTLLSIATIIAFSFITILAWIGLLVAVGLLLAYTVTSRIVHFFPGTLISCGKQRANSAYCFFRSHIPKTLFLDETGSNGISACKCCQAGTNAESMCTCTKTLNNSHQRVVGGLVESNHFPYHYGPRNAKDSDDDDTKPIDMASYSNTK